MTLLEMSDWLRDWAAISGVRRSWPIHAWYTLRCWWKLRAWQREVGR